MAKYAIVNSINYSSLTTDSLFISSAIAANGYYRILITTGPNANTYVRNTFAYSGNQPVYLFRFANSFADNIMPPSGTDSVIEYYCGFSAREGNYYRSGLIRDNNTEAYSSVSTTISILDNEYYGAAALYYANSTWQRNDRTGIFAEITEEITSQSDLESELISLGIRPISTGYPIAYNATNCTMSGPTEASGGTEVVVNVTPSSGYILRSSGVSVIDSTGVTVPHIVQGNQIAFTMPYAP